jgi:hypothetical protein
MHRHCPTRMLRHIVVLIVLLVAGCTGMLPTEMHAGKEAKAIDIVDALNPEVEALYLAWHRLDAVHKDIKALEKGFLFDGDDRQLGYIQKASLYVQDAALRIHYQWQRFSVLAYIRPQMIRDYLTLGVKRLTLDRDEIGYDRMFLRIYAPAIDNAAVGADLERALERIDDCEAILEKMSKMLEPVVGRSSLRL